MRTPSSRLDTRDPDSGSTRFSPHLSTPARGGCPGLGSSRTATPQQPSVPGPSIASRTGSGCPFAADSCPTWNRRLDYWRRAVHPTGGHPVINHRSETVRGARRAIGYGWCHRVVAAALAGCLLLWGVRPLIRVSATTSTSLGESFSINTPEGTVTGPQRSTPTRLAIRFPLPPELPRLGPGRLPSRLGATRSRCSRSRAPGCQAFDFYKDSGSLTISDAKSTGSGSKYVGSMKFSGITYREPHRHRRQQPDTPGGESDDLGCSGGPLADLDPIRPACLIVRW